MNQVWRDEGKALVAGYIAAGLGRVRIARRLTEELGIEVTAGMVAGLITRNNFHAPLKPGRVKGLRPDHPAIEEMRTVFPGRVRDPFVGARRGTAIDAHPHVLVTGHNQKKLGAYVEKGAWSGMPIYSLTLEERATCPASCHNWKECMGNSMHWSVRYRHGPELEARLAAELAELQQMFPSGFVVRLHLLGDFVSVAYVRRWAGWLDRFPALRVFGYTARLPTTAIGAAVARLSAERWDRFAVRLSSPEPGPGRAVTLWSTNPVPGVLICPAQLGKTKSCGSCALCWSPAARDRTIGFIAHGR